MLIPLNALTMVQDNRILDEKTGHQETNVILVKSLSLKGCYMTVCIGNQLNSVS